MFSTKINKTLNMDYELLDFGKGRRLERVGGYRLIRSDIRAEGPAFLSEREWMSAYARFVGAGDERGEWITERKAADKEWLMDCLGLKLAIKLGSTKQLGFFPEQCTQWKRIEMKVRSAAGPFRLLNLFGYTGVASLVAARAGASVTHVDASRPAIAWGRQNQRLSGLEESAIRWVCEDALKFVKREARRGSLYDGIVLDPPAFGRGPKGEVWEFRRDLQSLLTFCVKLLSARPNFVILNAYTGSVPSAISGEAMRTEFFGFRYQQIEEDELCLTTSDGRILKSGTRAYIVNFES